MLLNIAFINASINTYNVYNTFCYLNILKYKPQFDIPLIELIENNCVTIKLKP